VAEDRYRVLALARHPVQYMSPVLRRMARRKELDLTVAYCSLRGAEPGYDPEFGTKVQWDMPLLEGYRWVQPKNLGSGGDSFFGINNPGVWKIIRQGQFDAVLCFTGYRCATFWIAWLAAKMFGAAFLFGTDAITLTPRDGQRWKLPAKKLLWRWLFRRADQVIVPSSGSRDLILSLPVPSHRITVTPYSVDNDWWMEQSGKADRQAVRRSWGIGPSDAVVLFCAKLQPWKRPLDPLRALTRAGLANAHLVYAGEGPMRAELETEAARLGIANRVKFLGFVNQSQLPPVYTASDVMVLSSEYEPFAVVVNEAMCCGCPVIASDHVGAARDLVSPVAPEMVYPCGDVDALSAALRRALSNPEYLASRAAAALVRIQSWSPKENIDRTIEAIGSALARRSDPRRRAQEPVSPVSSGSTAHPQKLSE
jgi:glycosyltransferase involved in cell wall biosynthesis